MFCSKSEAESKEKHGVWDPMPGLTITSPYVHSRVDSSTFTMDNPMPELTLTLCQKSTLSPTQGLGIWPLLTRFNMKKIKNTAAFRSRTLWF
jgi:hypothetical protein